MPMPIERRRVAGEKPFKDGSSALTPTGRLHIVMEFIPTIAIAIAMKRRTRKRERV